MNAPAEQNTVPVLSLKNVIKSFLTLRSETIPALVDINLDIYQGHFVVIVGASGCGKTTLLNLIAGFEFPTSGDVLIDGIPVKGPGVDRMMMFQEHALFPWLKVIDNVMFGLHSRQNLNEKEKRERARYYLNMVELGAFENAHIHELSGGMKQRVALARTLAPDPEIILFDEPFGSLDALTRERFYVQIQAIFAKTRKTGLFVTHNVREAACLGDHVIVMSSRPGRITCDLPVPLPRPRDFYDPEVSRIAGHILQELRKNITRDNEDCGSNDEKSS